MIPKRHPYLGKSYKIYTDYNEINVYVEDTNFESLYEEIFRRCNLKIRKVFSLEGKTNVIDKASNCKDNKCVYIIDRDWDDIQNKTPKIKKIIVLNKHSIENYLLDYSGFRSLVLADNPRKSIESILSSDSFDSIVKEVSVNLKPLFECFLAMQIKNCKGKNCSYKPDNFQKGDRSCAPDEKKIAEFISSKGISIPKKVREYFDGEVLLDKGHGKYMLHFIWKGLRHKIKVMQISNDSLKIRLAQTVDVDIFGDILEGISKTARHA